MLCDWIPIGIATSIGTVGRRQEVGGRSDGIIWLEGGRWIPLPKTDSAWSAVPPEEPRGSGPADGENVASGTACSDTPLSAGFLPVVFSVRFCLVRGARVPIYLCNNGEMCTALQHSSTPALQQLTRHTAAQGSRASTASHPARAQTSETAQPAQPAQTRETQQRTRRKQGENKAKTREKQGPQQLSICKMPFT